jgi:hypothetical protein
LEDIRCQQALRFPATFLKPHATKNALQKQGVFEY